MIQHQQSLCTCRISLKKHNMKLNIRSEAWFSKPNVNDGEDVDGDIGESGIHHNLPSTRFNIHNEDDLNKALDQIV